VGDVTGELIGGGGVRLLDSNGWVINGRKKKENGTNYVVTKIYLVMRVG